MRVVAAAVVLPEAMRIACTAVVVVAALATATLPAHADEGMWLLNDFPKDLAKKAVGAAPDDALLTRVQLGSARLANGCSASFVSDDGLVMTNHHCIRSCLEELSTPARDLLENPFVALTHKDELRCEKLELNQLTSIVDVTDQVLAAVRGASGAEYAQKLKAANAGLEGACTQGDKDVRCDVVALWSGARHHLYKYRRFRDVRLAFAPEFPMAAFGGDPDNFEFPRTGFDAALVRVWDGAAPAKTPWRLRFAKKAVGVGDVVYVSGHPGGTERSASAAELEFQRDVALPWHLLRLAEARGRMDEWMKGSPDRTRTARARLRTIENGLKALRGRFEVLAQDGFMDERRARQAALETAAPPSTKASFDAVRAAQKEARALWGDARLLEHEWQSELFTIARHIVRMRAERDKPDAARLPEYTAAQLPFVEKQVLAPTPIPLDLEEASLAWTLHRLRNLRGADDAAVRQVLGKESPEAAAKRLVATKLGDVAFRKAALEAKKLPADPMLELAAKVDASARAARKAYEDKVDAVVKKSAEGVAEARRVVEGTSGYPDATFTLRLSFGHVRAAQGEKVAVTTVGDLRAKDTGAYPFALSPAWAKSKIAPATPLNVATTNDIIGGNSGSPLLDARGDVVGLVFDGNLPSLGGRYTYEPGTNRAVAVHAAAIRGALVDVYGAPHLWAELSK